METYLVHHGIMGQRWGIRRYQNSDGTLTEEGKKRQRLKDNEYKQKSLGKVEKFYDKNYRYGLYGLSKQEGIDSIKEKLKNENLSKSEKTDLRLRLKYKEQLKDLEKRKVKNLTHDQIAQERKIVGKSYTKAVGATVAGSIALPGVSWLIFVPQPQKDLSSSRISDIERSKVLDKSKGKRYKGNIKDISDIDKIKTPEFLDRRK